MSNEIVATKKPSALATITPVIVLVVICAVAGVLLGAVNYVTAPVAAAVAEQQAQETYAALIPEAASFEEVDCSVENCTAALQAVDASGNPIGYIFVTQAKGYGGQVPIAFAFDTEGNVTNVTAMANEETPGLGSRITDFVEGWFVGRGAQSITIEDIDAISGATISSRASVNAFNVAVQAFEEVQ